MKSRLVDVYRRNTEERFQEIKDPTVVLRPDKSYFMMASVGSSVSQQWRIGRFEAAHPAGPWQELEFADVQGIEGPEVCAPALQLEERDSRLLYKMYVQTSCFREDGIIALAESQDGKTFRAVSDFAISKDHLPARDIPIVGLYDVGISEITHEGKEYDCMTFSAYRRVGCGDLYASLREKGAPDASWSTPALILKQEDVPFHNHPESPNFEWGLEGAKIHQIADNAFMMIGVCFLEKGLHEIGTRQRVFFAAAESPLGPFRPVTTPIPPTRYDIGEGENGHPDTVDLGEHIGILYQERAGHGKPWHLRYAEASKAELIARTDNAPSMQVA